MSVEHGIANELPRVLAVVVASGDPESRASISNAIRSITPYWNIEVVTNHDELFIEGLHGGMTEGNSNLIFLDDDYIKEWEDWDFSGTTWGKRQVGKLKRKGMSRTEANLYTRPGGINFSATFRLDRYDQKIIVVSHVLPSEKMIKKVEEELGIPILIDGVLSKSYPGISLHAVHRQKTPDGIKVEDIKMEGDLTDSLSWLLPRVLG